MGVKVSYDTKKDGFPDMIKRLEAVNGSAVEVGVLKGESKWLAGIHEWGCDIPVTKKMRKYLASKGLRLRKETTHIHIPERSFLRAGFDDNQEAIREKAQKVLADVAAGKTTERGLCQAVGMVMASKIKDYARDLQSPENHPFTVEQKGSSNPLVSTGDMIGGITWRIAK